MLMAIKERTDIGVDSASAEDYVKAFGWDGETEWELMKELANYKNAHLTNDEPTRYGYGKARLAKFEAKEAAGDSWYCDYIKSDGTKCKIAKMKVEGATKCYQHLGKENPVQGDDGDKEEEQQDRDESPQINQGLDKKRSRDENSEGDSSRKHMRIVKAKCTGKKKDGHDCTFQAQWGTEKCGIHAKTS